MASNGTAPPQIPSQIGRYRILGIAGRWTRGWFYHSRDTTQPRPALVKTLCPPWASDQEFRLRFQREAQAAAVVNHPNIITVYEFGEHAGMPFTVFEALEGKNLLQLMNTGISLKTGLPVMLQVLDGLAYMNARGIIHRDIKPSSIFVCKDGSPLWAERTLSYGRAKITDFCLAQLITTGEPRMEARGSWTSLLLGTPSYLSPEQVRGEATDPRTDLFSLGCVIYELVTGRKPFGAEDGSAVLHGILNEEPDMGPISQGPEWERLRRVIARALQKKPEDRYADASALSADLKLALKELGPHASWTPPPLESSAPTWKH